MPTLARIFKWVKFPPDTFSEIVTAINKISKEGVGEFGFNTVRLKDDTWSFDSIDEFLFEYGHECQEAKFLFHINPGSKQQVKVFIQAWIPNYSSVEITAQNRETIAQMMSIFDRAYEYNKMTDDAILKYINGEVRIFIGHGRNPAWKEIKDHLKEQHGFDVISYETGARGGYSIKETLENIKNEASFALIVHTAENKMADGTIHARDNVLHETGIFQGVLGFTRAIVLLEEGCSEFSNIAGVHQVRFSKGNIKESFGEVLAILRREFGR
jgi:predicted nucleotide-binding protein